MSRIDGYDLFACKHCGSIHIRPHKVTFQLNSESINSPLSNSTGLCTICLKQYDLSEFIYLGIKPSIKQIEVSGDENPMYVRIRRFFDPTYGFKAAHIADEYPILY